MPLPRVKNALLIMAVKGAHEARYGRGKDAERDSDAFPWDNPEKSISLERFGLRASVFKSKLGRISSESVIRLPLLFECLCFMDGQFLAFRVDRNGCHLMSTAVIETDLSVRHDCAIASVFKP